MSSAEQWGVGSKAGDKAFATALVGKREVELIFGEHPHSRSDRNIYARFSPDRIEAFDGHRILTRVEVEEENYLKESELSGDEIRKGGSCRIFFDGVQCYEFFTRDATEALITARQLIRKLHEHESGWSDKRQREKLPGRKVLYHDRPHTVKRLIEDQGCVILTPAGGGENDYVKCEVDDPHIWWWETRGA